MFKGKLIIQTLFVRGEYNGNFIDGIGFGQKPGFKTIGAGAALKLSVAYPLIQSVNILGSGNNVIPLTDMDARSDNVYILDLR